MEEYSRTAINTNSEWGSKHIEQENYVRGTDHVSAISFADPDVVGASKRDLLPALGMTRENGLSLMK